MYPSINRSVKNTANMEPAIEIVTVNIEMIAVILQSYERNYGLSLRVCM